MAGNTLGARRYYAYTSDTGETYTVLTDKDLGDAAGLTESTANPTLPRRFKPRGVYAEAIIGGVKRRKFLICDATSILFEDTSQTFTIDTTQFRTTGRKGESFSFGSNPA